MTNITSLCRPMNLFSTSKLLISPKNIHFLHTHNISYRGGVKNNINLSKKNYTTASSAVSGQKLPDLELELELELLGLERESMPKHIALALDGNRRWLDACGRDLDYTPFFDKNLLFAKLCLKWGISKGTSFMWGLGNFTKRGEKANNLFLGQFQKFLQDNFKYFDRTGIKVMAMGETSMLAKSLQETIKQVEEATINNTNLELSLPVCYTGQRDITNATRKLCEKVKEGVIQPSDISEQMIEKELSIPTSPVFDLFIRTGGEMRVGALFAWQVSHAELYFTNTLAPDFDEDVFVDALHSYQQRNRKFGK